jgi:hypothetical protein
MADSGNQVEPDVRSLGDIATGTPPIVVGSDAGRAMVSAEASEKRAVARRRPDPSAGIQTIVAHHSRSFDAELGRRRPRS